MGFFDSEFKAVQFNRPGDSVTGTITGAYTERQQTVFGSSQLKFNANGTPAMMAVVPLQTNERDPLDPKDTGERTLYVDKVSMKMALQSAMKAVGAKDLEVGGQVFVQYTHDVPSDKGNPAKEFTAQYAPAQGGLGLGHTNGAPVASTVGPSTPPAFPQQSTPDYWPQPGQQPPAQFAPGPQQPAFPVQPPAPGLFAPPAQAQPPAPAAPVPDASPQIAAIRAMAASGMTAVQISAAIPTFTADAVQAVMGLPA